jgi:hypothetical protein
MLFQANKSWRTLMSEANRFLILHRPDGEKIWVDNAQIVTISGHIGGPDGASAALTTLAGLFHVQETPEYIASKLGWKA